MLHQPGHRAACHVDPLPPQLPPNFPHPIDLEIRIPDPSDSQPRLHVAARAGRRLGRIGPPGGMGVVSRRGDKQHSADRLDLVNGAVRVDEGDRFLNERSSSAWAKYADALRRISFAWRNSRTSRSSALIRSCSSVGGPGRLPWSRSARRTQFRSVSGLQPIFAAIEPIVAHCEACSPSCSNSIRTARSRTSGAYLGDACFVMMTPSSQKNAGPLGIPVRFTPDRAGFQRHQPDPRKLRETRETETVSVLLTATGSLASVLEPTTPSNSLLP